MELASHLDMTEQTKITWFMKGLKPSIKDHLVNVVNQPLTLEAWEPLVISINTNLHQHKIGKHIESGKKKKDSDPHPPKFGSTPISNPSPTSNVVPMNVDAVTTSLKPHGLLTSAK